MHRFFGYVSNENGGMGCKEWLCLKAWLLPLSSLLLSLACLACFTMVVLVWESRDPFMQLLAKPSSMPATPHITDYVLGHTRTTHPAPCNSWRTYEAAIRLIINTCQHRCSWIHGVTRCFVRLHPCNVQTLLSPHAAPHAPHSDF